VSDGGATSLRRCGLAVLTVTSAAAVLGPAPVSAAADPLAPDAQIALLRKTQERQQDYNTPAFRALQAAAAARRVVEQVAIPVNDPERLPLTDPCTVGAACVGDVRLDRWETDAGGIVRPVLFTARDGATLSGHVWATRSGPARRPAILIINGSILAFEEIYWWAAQTLAKAGYVVMTFDAQGEGRSDQFGEDPDRAEAPIAGTPPLGSGLPFYDGGADALGFLLSTPDEPYVPVASRTSSTSHAPKQARRVRSGLNPAFNPLWDMIDPARIGLAGHSYGAIAASYLAQSDPRVGAAVGWDSLCRPVQPAPTELEEFSSPGSGIGPGLPTALNSFGPRCFGAPPAPQPKLSKPALGLTGDYLLTPVPYTSAPDPLFKSQASHRFSAAGVDSGQIIIRGGTHSESSYIPLAAATATLRGIDLIAWYTAAWFDKYLRDDPTADARLLTDRWRHDAANAAVDTNGDTNLFSELYRSRLDIRTATGTRVTCEDLRAGCRVLRPAADDCGPNEFGYLRIATSADTGTNPLVAACSTTAVRCASRRRFTIRIGKPGQMLRKIVVRINGRRVAVRAARAGGPASALIDLRGRSRSTVAVTITARTGAGRPYREIRRYRLCRRSKTPGARSGKVAR